MWQKDAEGMANSVDTDQGLPYTVGLDLSDQLLRVITVVRTTKGFKDLLQQTNLQPGFRRYSKHQKYIRLSDSHTGCRVTASF